jgi:nucleoside-diphosphate kinase
VAEALLIFKPDAAHRIAVRAGVWSWLRTERDWKLVALTWYQPPGELVHSHYDFLQARTDMKLTGLRWFHAPRALIEQHYDFLEGKPFFPWLVDFMTSLPVLVGRLDAEPEGLERMRYELGETRIHESRPGSLRERYGIGGGVNVLHISDSPESGSREIELWRRYLPLEALDAELPVGSELPDHTFHLRSLASQYGAGVHTDLAAQEIKRLLREDTDLPVDGFEALTRVVLGAFSS